MCLTNRNSPCRVFAALIMCFALEASRLMQAGAPEPDPPAAKGAVKLFHIEAAGVITFHAISPSSKTLAYCDAVYRGEGKPVTSDLILIDLTNGKELHRKQVDYASGGIFSPDGKLLAFGTRDSAASVWDVARWEPKVQLKRPKGYSFGCPLAFSPDEKFVAGRLQRNQGNVLHGGQAPLLFNDLVIWDLSTGDCRVLDGNAGTYIGDVTGTISDPPKDIPSSGPFVGNAPLNVIFPANGEAGKLFVEYCGMSSFTSVWDVAKGKPLRSEWGVGGTATDNGPGVPMAGKGDPNPGSAADLYRFRTTPADRILALPKYDPLPIIALPFNDGTIAIAVRPSEKDYHIAVPEHNRKFTELCRLEDFKGTISYTCRLTADGKRLVALGVDPQSKLPGDQMQMIRVWDVSSLLPVAARKMTTFTGAERDKLWTRLFEHYPDTADCTFNTRNAGMGPSQNAGLAAALSLSRQPDDAVPWLRDKLGPPWDLKKVPQLIEDLDSADFTTRDRASRQLEQIGSLARPFLERVLAKDPPPETKRRAEPLLDKLKGADAAYELRQLRIIDLLEHINTAAARELLKDYAEGKYDPAFADEAKQALKRIADKP